MAHTHDVYDMENHFEINGSSRFIKETSETKLVVVQGDHKSEVLTFKMPRYIDGHDMTLCNKIRIHYINLDTKTNNKSADVYEVTDLTLCKECEDVLTFTWTIEAPATKYSGTLSFLVKFECTEGENVLYQWNTAKYVSVNVLAGIDNSEEFVEKYSNVLEEWYNELTKGADSIEELNQQAIAEIELAKEDAKEDIQGKADATMDAMNEFSTNTYNSFKNNVDAKNTAMTNHANETFETFNDDVDEKAAKTLEMIPDDYSELDAEVKNIRVGANGKTYGCAGDAVRGQFEDFTQVYKSNNINGSEYEIGYIDEKGNMHSYSDCARSIDFIPVIGGKSIYYVRGMSSIGSSQNCIWFNEYDADKIFIKQTFVYNYDHRANTNVITDLVLDNSTKFIKLSMQHSNVPLDEIGIAIFYTEYEATTYEPFIQKLCVDGNEIVKNGKRVNIPEKNSELENDSGFITLEDVENITRTQSKAVILFNFDNGKNYNIRAEKLEEYGFKGTFCANTFEQSDVTNYLKHGHDIALYGGVGERPTSYVDENAYNNWYAYIKEGVEYLNSLGVYYPTLYGCPNHKASQAIVDACKSLGFKYVSCGYKLVNGESWDVDDSCEYYSIESNSISNMALCSVPMDKTIDELRTIIETAIKNNQIVSFFTHNVEETVTSDINISLDHFIEILDVVKEFHNAGNLDVFTMREFYNKYHNEEGRTLDFTRTMSAIMDLKTL